MRPARYTCAHPTTHHPRLPPPPPPHHQPPPFTQVFGVFHLADSVADNCAQGTQLTVFVRCSTGNATYELPSTTLLSYEPILQASVSSSTVPGGCWSGCVDLCVGPATHALVLNTCIHMVCIATTVYSCSMPTTLIACPPPHPNPLHHAPPTHTTPVPPPTHTEDLVIDWNRQEEGFRRRPLVASCSDRLRFEWSDAFPHSLWMSTGTSPELKFNNDGIADIL